MYLTYSQLGFAALMLLGAGACFGVMVMALLAMSKFQEPQMDEDPGPHGYTDQDGETIYPGRDAWKHAVPKVPHAE